MITKMLLISEILGVEVNNRKIINSYNFLLHFIITGRLRWITVDENYGNLSQLTIKLELNTHRISAATVVSYSSVQRILKREKL